MIIKLITPAMIQYDITSDAINETVLNAIEANGYKIKAVGNQFEVCINSEQYSFRVFDNGIVVINYAFELSNDTAYTEILTKKEEKSKEIIDRDGAVVRFLKTLESIIATTSHHKKESYFFNGKYVSYCLTTYKVSEKNIDTAYSLALKRPIEKKQIASLQEQSLKIVNVNEHIKLLLIWGARVIVGDDELADKLYDDYVSAETEAQYLWFIITSLDKKIDSYMLNETGRAADLTLLLNTSYSVLYRKSKFDGVVSSKSHRYEIEIFNSIISASKIDYLYDNLESKIRLLKEKSSLVEEKLNKKNRKFVNIWLSIISFLSATSTIYGFVSVFQAGDKKLTYIIITIVALILFGGANLIQLISRKKSKGSRKKRKQ